MAYPTDKPSGNYSLRDSNFAELDNSKIPMDNNLWKNGYKNAEESEVESVPDAHEQNWLFDVLHRNLKYTQETAEENKRLLESKVASPTSIGQVKIGYGLEITSNGVLSVSKSVAEDANIISYDLPVGSYMLWSGKNTPEYFIEPSGQTLLRSSYPELWKFAQDNDLVGSLFGIGDGITKFTVTDIRGNFISIADSNDKVGKFTEAGLPNITGAFMLGGTESKTPAEANGAFYGDGYGGYRAHGHEVASVNPRIRLDASLSNPIYGKSNTVTPANWGLKLILKALPTPPSNAVPTGTVLDYTGSVAPDGYIIANGAELSRSKFNQLYLWAVYNNLIKNQSEIPSTAHAYYGTGNGSTTFTIPDLRGVQKASSDSYGDRINMNLGDFISSGIGLNNAPDYSKRVGLNPSVLYTAPEDGILYLRVPVVEGSNNVFITINDMVFDLGSGLTNREGNHSNTMLFLLGKNDEYTISCSTSRSWFQAYFIPYKTGKFGIVSTTPILKY